MKTRTTEEWLKQLGLQLPASDRERGEFYAPIAEYCNVSTATVGQWLGGKRLPGGEPLLRLRYWIAKGNVLVAELEKLDPAVKALGQLIADGELELEKVWQEIGYASRDGLFDALLRGHIPIAERLEKIREIVARHRRGGTSPAIDDGEASSKQVVLLALASLVKAVTPLADVMLSDEFSAEERQALRDATGGDGIYRLANMMNRLCSETARKAIKVYTG
ncbi:hypothetical protein C4552_00455 [Candidatus Parcubacteria bacterium]|nr:MAG: hypothetical protein C4552_00455 [Candidatus Parcubacteria bacterium]